MSPGRWADGARRIHASGWMTGSLNNARSPAAPLLHLRHWSVRRRRTRTLPVILQVLAQTRAQRNSSVPDAAAFTAEQIVVYARDHPKDPCHWFRGWARRADASELETVFLVLLDAREPEYATRLLRCFAQQGVPRFDSRLLPWLVHPDPMLGMTALNAVKSTRHPDLRTLALRWMADGDLEGGIRLLTANFEPGDFALCTPRLESVGDEDGRHRLASNFVAMCEANPSADALDGLINVYEFSPCSTCRHKAVKVLVDLDIAPDWLRQEARLDVDPETRALLYVETWQRSADTP